LYATAAMHIMLSNSYCGVMFPWCAPFENKNQNEKEYQLQFKENKWEKQK